MPIKYGVKLNRVRNSSETVLAGDSISLQGPHFFRASDIGEPIYANDMSSLYYQAYSHARHLHKSNVLWFDGHCTSEALTYPDAYGPQYRKSDVGCLSATPPNMDTVQANYYFWLDKRARTLNTGGGW